ncbi:hypothetical protein GH741_02470 [Aquibacillus halophilus]|uniref:Uncharacterized protein n=1 Tax=Aquibacillus halophilus TaxID=930132 RepID=A0A6A8DAG6_9BACI|nr:hypothetical protein [Aquibacillus halophilus]MRH41536.1 hypothetical protein [Aquibacillus halophilus]
MKRCKVCRKKPRIRRRVNNEGILFCSDDCYEEFEDSPDDIDHPYINDYEAIRYEYIQWMNNYVDDLYMYWLYGAPKKESLLEQIDDLLGEFIDFYALEGQDGVFSAEIYNYLIDFEQLQKEIRNFEVDEKELKKRREVLYEEKRRRTEKEMWG